MIKKKLLVSGYSSYLCRNFKKNNKFQIYNYRKLDSFKVNNFSFFIHFAVINKISPNHKDLIQEIELIENCLDISKKLKIKKFILMSTFQPKKKLNSYQLMKKKLEQKVLISNLDIIILRPTKIISKLEYKILQFIIASKLNLFLNYKPNNPILLDDFISILNKIINKDKNFNYIIDFGSSFNCKLKNVNNLFHLENLCKINLQKTILKN